MKLIILSLVAMLTFSLTSCNNTSETETITSEINTTALTTTTTTIETTVTEATEKTTTSEDNSSQSEAELEYVSGGNFTENGSTMEIYQNLNDYSWVVNLKYSENDINNCTLLLTQIIQTFNLKVNELGMPIKINICGYYNEEMIYICMLEKENDEYELTSLIWLNDEYKTDYDSSK